MIVEIVCPNCAFTAKVAKEKIPQGVRWATCPRCKGRFEFSPRIPGQGDKEGQRVPSAWENRIQVGLWSGITTTFKAVLFSPRGLFHKLALQGGMREPLAFGLLWGSLGTMFGVFWQFLMISEHLLSMRDWPLGEFTGIILFLAANLLTPLYVLTSIFVSSALLHGCLLIFKGGENGFQATFRVVSYSQAACALAVVPFVGSAAGWIWQLCVQFIGLREIHGISYGKVFAAFLLPLALGVFVVAAIVVPLLIGL